LIELYEATYKPDYLRKAVNLNDELIKLFWDQEKGDLFLYGSDSEQLIARPKEIYDGATPSGNSVAALNFLRLARLTGRFDLEEKAQVQFNTFGAMINQVPKGHAFSLMAILFSQMHTKEVVLVSDEEVQLLDPMIDVLRKDFRPFVVSLLYSDTTNEIKTVAPYVENYKSVDGKAAAYVCENFACRAPVTDAGQFQEMLQ